MGNLVLVSCARFAAPSVRLCQYPGRCDRGQLVCVAAPDIVSMGKSKDTGQQCYSAKDEEHQREEPRSQNVQNSREYGEAREDKANSGCDHPEASSQRHPRGNINDVVSDVGQMPQAKIDRAESKYPASDE